MTATPRYLRDLFETTAPPKSIPSHAEAAVLELLKALLTEALAAGTDAATGDASKEADHDQDHS